MGSSGEGLGKEGRAGGRRADVGWASSFAELLTYMSCGLKFRNLGNFKSP
jgi:hypothetical protein